MKSEVIRKRLLEECRKAYPNEACGYVIISEKGQFEVISCENSAHNPRTDFRISPRETLRVKKLGRVVAGYHSHPDGKAKLSTFDEMFIKLSEMPMYVVSIPEGRISYFTPENVNIPYEGREYKLGYQDCYTIVTDWARKEKGLDIPMHTTPEKWWESGKENRAELFGPRYAYKVDSFKECEVVLFQIDAPVPNHMAIKVGNDKILHHLINRLSCIDHWNRFWQSHAVSYWRFKENL